MTTTVIHKILNCLETEMLTNVMSHKSCWSNFDKTSIKSWTLPALCISEICIKMFHYNSSEIWKLKMLLIHQIHQTLFKIIWVEYCTILYSWFINFSKCYSFTFFFVPISSYKHLVLSVTVCWLGIWQIALPVIFGCFLFFYRILSQIQIKRVPSLKQMQ